MAEACLTKQPQGLSVFEKYLTAWVLLCIGAGIVLGKDTIAESRCENVEKIVKYLQ